jgi:hypothetical protein
MSVVIYDAEYIFKPLQIRVKIDADS